MIREANQYKISFGGTRKSETESLAISAEKITTSLKYVMPKIVLACWSYEHHLVKALSTRIVKRHVKIGAIRS